MDLRWRKRQEIAEIREIGNFMACTLCQIYDSHKIKRMSWIRHAALSGNEFKFSVRKAEGKRTPGDPNVDKRKI